MYYIIADTAQHFERCLKEKGIDRSKAKYINEGHKLMGVRIEESDKVIVYGFYAERFWELFKQVQIRMMKGSRIEEGKVTDWKVFPEGGK